MSNPLGAQIAGDENFCLGIFIFDFLKKFFPTSKSFLESAESFFRLVGSFLWPGKTFLRQVGSFICQEKFSFDSEKFLSPDGKFSFDSEKFSTLRRVPTRDNIPKPAESHVRRSGGTMIWVPRSRFAPVPFRLNRHLESIILLQSESGEAYIMCRGRQQPYRQRPIGNAPNELSPVGHSGKQNNLASAYGWEIPETAD